VRPPKRQYLIQILNVGERKYRVNLGKLEIPVLHYYGRWTTSGLLNITDWSWSWSGRTLVSFICGRCCFCHFKPFSHQFLYHTSVRSFWLVYGRHKPGIDIRLVLPQVIPNWYVLLYQYSS
jgi:hypothetical protein